MNDKLRVTIVSKASKKVLAERVFDTPAGEGNAERVVSTQINPWIARIKRQFGDGIEIIATPVSSGVSSAGSGGYTVLYSSGNGSA